ncbi:MULTISPECIES: hypothetical protein [unclassified Caballeronia]|jgi:hypothetical protein|uniref:hypothetical protein n=1 Tax=unclassified Caballeronia TaxID=2646786 RepID=UPI002027C184|nr:MULTISPECIES: hypothetical protein [unclassified Caballeronia]
MEQMNGDPAIDVQWRTGMPDREKKRRVKDPGLGESPYGVSVKPMLKRTKDAKRQL